MSQIFNLTQPIVNLSSVKVNGSAVGVTYTVDYPTNKLTLTSPLTTSDIVSVTYSYQPIATPLARSNFIVYKDAVELADVDLESIQINNTVDGSPYATFTINRKHDNLNYTLDDTLSNITNKPIITIEFNNQLLFTGWLVNIKTDSNSERLQVRAEGAKPSSLTTSDNVLLRNPATQSIVINNADIYTPIWPGSAQNTRDIFPIVPASYPKATIFSKTYTTSGTFRLQKTVSTKIFGGSIIDLPLQTLNKQLDIYEVIINDVEINAPLTSSEVSYDTGNYNGVKVHLGKKIQEIVLLDEERVIGWDGLNSWSPKDDMEYFFLISGTRFDPEDYTNTVTLDEKYIGSQLSVTDDLWEIDDTTKGVLIYSQKKCESEETDLGWYYIGIAPYKEITCENGQYFSVPYYEDRENGLYIVRNVEYDYVNYAKIVAQQEFNALGLSTKYPQSTDTQYYKTTLNITLTIDALLYYKIKLLSKINITNTTTSNIYRFNLGFPISVKEIVVDSGTMLATVKCDTSKASELSAVLADTVSLSAITTIAYAGSPKASFPNEYDDLEPYSYKEEDKYSTDTGEKITTGTSTEDERHHVVITI